MTQVIRTVLEVDASKAVAGFGQGEKAVQGYERAVTRAGDVTSRRGGFDKLSGSIRDNRAAWDDLSSKALIGGAALATGMGFATKAAIDWESAWAGVVKTTDGTDAQMAELEEGLRGLTQVLPATHEEIAGVAEAAGQLGVAREDVLGFTETAIGLGESTNLSAEVAAESLAKFSNIMGTASREGVEGYERMGSALVALGNDGASTEADIMAMSLRLAGAGKQIGATEADILAMSNALSSVGIEAELGGGAMSRAMLKMNTAVISGGDELESFSDIAGMTASEFATAWREDPIAATNAFITGLGKIGESGGDASAALSDVGLKGTQNAQVLLRAAGASDLMTESLELGAQAWKDNTALQKEAETRYETTASKLQIAQNSARNAAIDFGSVLAPALESVATKTAGAADAFVKLPGPVKATISGVTGVTAATLLFGGATVKAVGAAHDFRDRLDELGMLTPRVERGLNGAAAGAKALGLTLAAMSAAGAAGSALQGLTQTEYALESLNKRMLEGESAVGVWSDAIAESAGVTGTVEPGVRSFDDAMRVALDPSYINKGSDAMSGLAKVLTLGMGDFETASDQAQRAFAGIDEQLSTLVSTGNAEEAARQVGEYEAAAKKAGFSSEEFRKLIPGYTEAVAAAGNQAKLTGDDTSGMGDDVAGLGEDMQQAEQDAKDLRDAIRSLGDELLQQEATQDGYEASLDEVTASIKENGKTLDASTEKGRANRAALRDLANSTQEWAAAEFTATGNVKATQKILDEGRKAWIRHRDALGENKKETRDLADELFKIDGLDAKAKVDVNTVEAERSTDGFLDKMKDIDGQVAEATVKESGAQEARDKVLGFRDSIFGLEGTDVEVTEHGATSAKSRVMAFNESIIDTSGKTVTVTEANSAAAAKGRVDNFRTSIAEVDGKWVTVTEVGSTAAGNRVVQFKGQIYEVPPERSVTINANTGAALAAIAGVQAALNAAAQPRTATITTRRINTGEFAEGGFNYPARMAEGGVVDSYRKQLPAGSVAPGLYPTSERGILMAEDKRSKWESYIPERPDLRGRAEAILAETARRFGKQVIPMASGGIRSYYTLGEISEDEWYRLRALGWKGRAGDNVERIYRPKAKPKAAPKRVTPRAVASKHAARTYVGPGAAAAGRSGDTPLSGSSVGLIDYDRMGASVAKHIRALPPTPLYPTQRQYARATKDALDRWEGR